MLYKHIIILNEQEQIILERLSNDRGYRKQEIFRFGLREINRKEFPPYNEPKKQDGPFDQYTNEEYCERIKGGRVENGYCIIEKTNGQTEKIPITRVKIL